MVEVLVWAPAEPIRMALRRKAEEISEIADFGDINRLRKKLNRRGAICTKLAGQKPTLLMPVRIFCSISPNLARCKKQFRS